MQYASIQRFGVWKDFFFFFFEIHIFILQWWCTKINQKWQRHFINAANIYISNNVFFYYIQRIRIKMYQFPQTLLVIINIYCVPNQYIRMIYEGSRDTELTCQPQT